MSIERINRWVRNGEKAYRLRLYRKAYHWFRRAAKYGDNRALKRMGDLYYCGLGVEEDDGKALNYYSEAYDRGNTEARYFCDQIIHIFELSM